MAHAHSVYDTGIHFLINPITRGISRDDTNKTVLIQHDHNSERCTFELPRYVDGHDMMLCNRVQVHYINTDGKDSTENIYEVDDLAVSPEGDNVVVFSWLISGNATKYVGVLSFVIRFACLTGDTVDYAWHTGIYTGISVSSGILNDAEALIEPYVDVLEQWKARLFGVGDTQEQRLLDVSAAQQEAIQAKGDAVLASIPEEYTALQAQADDNSRLKAVAIVQSAEGESIVVNDSADAPLLGLKLFGRSTQDGTPSPDAPVEIVSVENPDISVCGKNLFDMSKITTTDRITKNADGTLSVSQYANSTLLTLKELAPALSVGMKCRIDIDTDGAKFIFLTVLNSAWDNNKELEITEAALNSLVNVYGMVGQTDGSTIIRSIQIVLSGYSSEYEQYKGIQTGAIPRILHGIPVTSGGNYTDADGQQWICDEVDFERNVYVHRVAAERLAKVTYYNEIGLYVTLFEGKSKYDTKYICSHYADGVAYANGKTGAYASCVLPKSKLPESVTSAESGQAWLEAQMAAGTPVIAVYVLTDPVETPLSDAEIATYKALVTHKPTTTILNDGGAHMAVEYAADTKTYIANAIAAAMTEGATT